MSHAAVSPPPKVVSRPVAKPIPNRNRIPVHRERSKLDLRIARKQLVSVLDRVLLDVESRPVDLSLEAQVRQRLLQEARSKIERANQKLRELADRSHSTVVV